MCSAELLPARVTRVCLMSPMVMCCVVVTCVAIVLVGCHIIASVEVCEVLFISRAGKVGQ